MKIRLPKHTLGERQKVHLKDIPIGYVDTENVDRSIRFAINKDFVQESKRQLRPYDEFQEDDLYFFDNKGDLLKNVPMKRLNDRYYYEPQNTIEFAPTIFTCYAEVKRQMQFSNATQYNLIVGAVDNEDLSLSKKLLPAFSDAYKRGLVPANIRINSGAIEYASLVNHAAKDCDFVFIESDDGVKSKVSGQAIDVDYYLDRHVNLWLSVKDFQGMFRTVYSAQIPEIDMDDPILFKTKKYSLKYRAEYKVFDDKVINPDYPSSTYDYIYICDRILVLRKQGKGYIIVTNEDFLEDIQQNAHLLYETLMKVYLNGYYKSREEKTWITDEPIDYLAYSSKKYGERQGKVNLPSLLRNTKINFGENYQLLRIKVSDDNVFFVGLDKDKNLLFEKAGGNKDPKKKADQISYMTTRNTVMYYEPEEIYYEQDPISLSSSIDGSDGYITVDPYKNSAKRIYTEYPQTIKLPDVTRSYLLCVKPSVKGMDNEFHVVLPEEYSRENNGEQVASITIEQTSDPTISDIRVMGGGLPEDQDDDFDMLDIGHVNGRPYRLGGTIVIRLPKKLKPFEARIRSEVEKHIAAGTYAFFAFE